MLVLHDPDTLSHDTVELLGSRLIAALESPERIAAIIEALQQTKHILHVIESSVKLESNLIQVLQNTHDTGYLDHLQYAHEEWIAAGHITVTESILPECFPTFQVPTSKAISTHSTAANNARPPKDLFARSGYYAFDMSSGIMRHTYQASLASANLAAYASNLARSTSSPQAVMALCRPPGHHCDTSKAGGYCYINNCVIAVESLLSCANNAVEKFDDLQIAILDLDFHHGNGTQSFFHKRQVRYISIHGADEYPYYTGHDTEVGEDCGSGFNHNFPLIRGTSAKLYLQTLERALDIALSSGLRFLVVSLGFDTFRLDPLGSFDLSTEDYFTIGQLISSRLLKRGIKTVFLLEGGYVIDSLGDNLIAFLNGYESVVV